jgi:hypothetical protein
MSLAKVLAMILTIDEALSLIFRLAPELAGVEILAGVEQLPSTGVAVHGFAAAGAPPTIVFRDAPSLEILLHEASHLLPAESTPPRDQPTPEIREWYLHRAITAPTMTELDAPWSGGHDLAFIRRCCHLWSRCEQLGIPVRQCAICAGAGLDNGIDEYRAVLGWEPVRCRNWAFADIEALPMPECFSDLFDRDKAAWLRWRDGATV